MNPSIHRLDRHEGLVRRLAEQAHPKTGASIFPTFRELACFAALLGFELDRRATMDGPTGLLVDGRIFASNDQSLDILYLLGLASTRDQDVLLENVDQETRLVGEFEQFVNGGLDVLAEWLAAEPTDADGDRAILGALVRGGFLADAERSDVSLDDVTF